MKEPMKTTNPHVLTLAKVFGDLMDVKPAPVAGSEAFDRMNRAVVGMHRASGSNEADYFAFAIECLNLLAQRVKSPQK
jgi:hypothetical protein